MLGVQQATSKDDKDEKSSKKVEAADKKLRDTDWFAASSKSKPGSKKN